jgi:hypothetical protein
LVSIAAHYQWFWNFIDGHCDISKISQQLCSRCDDYTITACYADETTCDASGGISGPTCPYIICRYELISYLRDTLPTIAYGILGFTIFIVIMIILNCCLVCYTKRDSVEEILYKAGIISTMKYSQVDEESSSQQLQQPLLNNHNSTGSNNRSNAGRRTVNAREVHDPEIEMMLSRGY